jgi:hypothetical protein
MNDERRKRATLHTAPGVQLDHIPRVVDTSLKRWRVSHFLTRGTLIPLLADALPPVALIRAGATPLSLNPRRLPDQIALHCL